jgi:hypothetical protein
MSDEAAKKLEKQIPRGLNPHVVTKIKGLAARLKRLLKKAISRVANDYRG